MNVLDIILIIPIIFFSIKGFMKGVINQVTGILGLIIGLVSAFYFSENVKNLLNKQFNIELEETLIFLILFVLIFIIFKILGVVLTKGSKNLSISPINRLFGLTIGLVQGFLIASIVCLVLEFAIEQNILTEVSKINSSLVYIQILEFLHLIMPDLLS